MGARLASIKNRKIDLIGVLELGAKRFGYEE